MKHEEDVTTSCEECGASIYQQHLNSGIARYEDGKLLCAHCVADYEKKHDATSGGESDMLAPIQLESEHDEQPAPSMDMSSSRIHGASEATLGHMAGGLDESRFKRPLQPDNPGATRCRTFHCKLSDGALDFLNSQINEWLDKNENIVVKFTNTTIGPFEGKHTEPNLIMVLFY